MQYSLFMLAPERTTRELGEEAVKAGRTAFGQYAASLDAAGVLVSATMLQPSIATITVSVRDDDVVVAGRPDPITEERLMGTFVIEVADRDVAIEWAGKCPVAQWGRVEIRPSSVVFTDGAWRLAALPSSLR
jgi:hypothetical protein